MKSKTADITAKYQKMIDNIQWHLKTNKPTDKMELQKLYQQINDYREMIVDLETVAQFQRPVPDEAGEVYVWVKAMERLPDIDNKNPKHYLFLNEVNHHAIDIWTEFITNFPPLITSRLFDWKWLSPAPPSVEDAGKGWISVEEENMPLETDLIVKHPFGVEAIHFFNAEWTFWYTGKSCGSDLIKSITHWQKP